jgi:dynein heavy chain, axonemal
MCIVDGLHLNGAAWNYDQRCLIEQTKQPWLQLMPLMKIIPSRTRRCHQDDVLLTPVYMTSDRRNVLGHGYVFEAHLRTTRDISYWILNGVCLLLNDD